MRLHPIIFIAFAQNAVASVSNCCSTLQKNIDIPNSVVHVAEAVSAGTTLQFPKNSCSRPNQTVDVDLCRISITIFTGPTSSVTLEAWLPDDWTGRLLVVGNGGLDGCIHYEDLNYGAYMGFGTIGTDNGHSGGGEPFYKNPGTLEDFVYRSIEVASSSVKKIGRVFYGEPHTKSYYLGCSTGGRQAFKSVQSYPDWFDGVLAGAPALDFNALNYWSSHFYNLTGGPESETFLSSGDWDTVYGDVLKQCDGLDGVPDGVLEDPQLCQYRPESLICSHGQSGSCLTAAQAATVRAVFSPVYGPDGDLVYPRLQPGANSTTVYFSGQPFQTSAQWFRYAIYNDPSWDPAMLNPQDWVAADTLNPFNVATWDADLSQFRQRGGKILHYHGLEDQIISSENSIRYYNIVARTMGATSGELDEFYRFFSISGMAHCSGGQGAWFIGNSKETAVSKNPDENILMALVRWVEDGVAPEVIKGTKFANGTKDSEMVFQRDHCKYPLRNHFDGNGDPNVASSWSCI